MAAAAPDGGRRIVDQFELRRSRHALGSRSDTTIPAGTKRGGLRAGLIENVVRDFHPLVADWFAKRYGEPTEPQVQGWPLIRAGRDVLITAPTGSGKTLAAFSICLDGLIRRAEAGELPDETLVVYVSPLKALTNDVRKNLETPLGELLALATERGITLDASGNLYGTAVLGGTNNFGVIYEIAK